MILFSRIYLLAFVFRVTQENAENGETTEDLSGPEVVADLPGSPQKEEATSDPSMETETNGHDAAEEEEMSSRDSPNVSNTSDVVSGTPPKPNSRRQSFITLEKYAEGKPASPSTGSTFIGPYTKMSHSQEHPDTKASPPQTPATPQSQDSTAAGSVKSEPPMDHAPESPVRPRDPESKYGPVRLTERLPSSEKEDEDVIPDTQAESQPAGEAKTPPESEEVKPSPDQDLEESQESQESQSAQTSLDKPRRPGRPRVRPRLSGEDSEEKEQKHQLKKKRRSQLEAESESPKSSSVQTRSKAESSGPLQTRAQREKSSQGRGQRTRQSLSQELPDKPQARRKSRGAESSQPEPGSGRQSDSESQSQGRYRRRSKASLEAQEEAGTKKAASPDKEGSRLAAPAPAQQDDDHSQRDSHTLTSPTPPEPELLSQAGQTEASPAEAPHTGDPSQESELMDEVKDELNSQMSASSSANEESQDPTSTESSGAAQVKRKYKRRLTSAHSELSQGDPSPSDSQTLRRSMRSKASEAEESSESKDSVRKQRRSSSQAALAASSPAEATVGGRRRKSNAQEDLLKQSPSSAPESSQSQDAPGSAEPPRGHGKYIRKRASQGSQSSVELSESSQSTENPPAPKKRGRKPRASLQSPLSLVPAEHQTSEADSSLKAGDSQSLEAAGASQPEEDSQEELPMEAEEADAIVESTDSEKTTETPRVSVTEEEQTHKDDEAAADDATPEVDLKAAEAAGSEQENEQTMACQQPESSHVDTAPQEAPEEEERAPEDQALEEEAPEKEAPEEEALEMEAPEEQAPEEVEALEKEAPKEEEVEEGAKSEQNAAEPEQLPPSEQLLEHAVLPGEDAAGDGLTTSPVEQEEEQAACIKEEEPPIRPAEACEHVSPPQENDGGDKAQAALCQDDADKQSPVAGVDAALPEASSAPALPEAARPSPAKQKELEAVMAADMGQSPSSGRTRGNWSPSASPSTSILKKGQKRPPEEDNPSPLVKVREVTCSTCTQPYTQAWDSPLFSFRPAVPARVLR